MSSDLPLKSFSHRNTYLFNTRSKFIIKVSFEYRRADFFGAFPPLFHFTPPFSYNPLTLQSPSDMDVIRSTLQPVTHALPDPIRDLGLSLIGPDCYKSLILDIDITNTTCLKLALSKSLGIATVAGSSIVKLPQILKLLSSQSASGISFLSYALETSAFIIALAYSARSGFPFSTYGETAMIAAQNVVISLLVLRFDGRTVLATGFLGALLAGGWALFNEQAVDMGTLGYAQMGAGLLGVASKAPQIWTIYKQGGTGQLSAFAVSRLYLNNRSFAIKAARS